jgi:hypothetical protein
MVLLTSLSEVGAATAPTRTLGQDVFVFRYLRKTKKILCTTNVQFPEISLSKFSVSFLNLFGSFGFWSFDFVSDFEFRASDLVAAMPRCALRASVVISRVKITVEILRRSFRMTFCVGM